MKIFSEIEALEKELHTSSARKSKQMLNDLLADDFQEFGKSGYIYNKQDIIKHLPAASAQIPNAHAFKVKALDQNAFLVTYKTIENETHVLRSSIWMLSKGRLQMTFHQGTCMKTSSKHVSDAKKDINV